MVVIIRKSHGRAMVGTLTPKKKPLAILVCRVVTATKARDMGTKPSTWLCEMSSCRKSRKAYHKPVVVDSSRNKNRKRTVPTPFSKLLQRSMKAAMLRSSWVKLLWWKGYVRSLCTCPLSKTLALTLKTTSAKLKYVFMTNKVLDNRTTAKIPLVRSGAMSLKTVCKIILRVIKVRIRLSNTTDFRVHEANCPQKLLCSYQAASCRSNVPANYEVL